MLRLFLWNILKIIGNYCMICNIVEQNKGILMEKCFAIASDGELVVVGKDKKEVISTIQSLQKDRRFQIKNKFGAKWRRRFAGHAADDLESLGTAIGRGRLKEGVLHEDASVLEVRVVLQRSARQSSGERDSSGVQDGGDDIEHARVFRDSLAGSEHHGIAYDQRDPDSPFPHAVGVLEPDAVLEALPVVGHQYDQSIVERPALADS